ncbi:NAD-dependent epimerase/dehydratase family protein [Candidatus Clostridium radicumherbarum]|uniref:NAD-dependent epimerase/dehydratase family protein n=1 Tax=Candidatus Clostridium radicumherbarum TaxID=3381662 RepID=A0ABW8TPU8_9CLOT
MGQVSFMGKNIVITGGCGFIGSHLIRRLLREDANIFLFNKSSTSTWRIKEYLNKVKIIKIDITNSLDVHSCIHEIKPDYVFHLAAYGMDSSQNDYIKAANTNIIGTINILSSLKEINCCKVINIGSCAEYGNRKEVMSEDMNLMPVSIYGSTKASGTLIAHQIAKENNIKIVTLRPFGIFGEGEERHKIFCHIIMSILEDRDVKLTNCEQYRDYCYVENIIDGMIMAAKNEAIENDVFNIACGELYPLKYYVELIFKNLKTDRKALYGAVKYKKNEMWVPAANISKIKSLLQWRPEINIEEGIIRTINWYKQNKYMFKMAGDSNG